MATFLSLLKAIPSIVSLLKTIITFLEFAKKEIDSAQRAKELKAGIDKANKSKDTSDLEGIFK